MLIPETVTPRRLRTSVQTRVKKAVQARGERTVFGATDRTG